MSKYILDGRGNPKPEPDALKWARWYETANRRVGRDTVRDVSVSTVFLGIDYNFNGDGEPVLFETMVFGGKHDQYTERYATKADALAGHERIVQMVSECR